MVLDLYVVIWSQYDDWQLLGVASDKEAAKQIKREAVGKYSYIEFNNVDIIPCNDGELVLLDE